MKKLLHLASKYGYISLLTLVFVGSCVLRFWNLENRSNFGFDQVTNGYVMMDWFLHGKWPLLGMVAKTDTGFYIGPAYYYLFAPFFWAFGMDAPMAGMVYAGTVFIATFWVMVLVVSRMFSRRTALMSAAVYGFSYGAVLFDRDPWPVMFIPLVSLLVMHFLYRSLADDLKNLIPLAAVIGFGFHTHFTAVYYVLFVLVFSPFILRRKDGWMWTLRAIPVFLVWLVCNVIADLGGAKNGINMLGYVSTYYHGLHLVRVLQLAHDGFIEFTVLLFDGFARYVQATPRIWDLLGIGLFLLFIVLSLGDRSRGLWKRRLLRSALVSVWFVIPWLVMSVYKGEITNYYFSVSLPIAAMVVGYILERLSRFGPAGLVLSMAMISVFAYFQIGSFVAIPDSKLREQRIQAMAAAKDHHVIPYANGSPESFLYYYYSTVGKDRIRFK